MPGNFPSKYKAWSDSKIYYTINIQTPFIQTKNGFVIFSAETRSKVALENPGSDFSTLSKIVGMNWRKLSNAQKRQYNSRAKALCEANANAEREKMEKMLKRNEIFIFTCGWGNACNYQFDSVEELIEHTKLHANGNCIKFRNTKIQLCTTRASLFSVLLLYSPPVTPQV